MEYEMDDLVMLSNQTYIAFDELQLKHFSDGKDSIVRGWKRTWHHNQSQQTDGSIQEKDIDRH